MKVALMRESALKWRCSSNQASGIAPRAFHPFAPFSPLETIPAPRTSPSISRGAPNTQHQ